jgi:hypothetical protein
MYCEDTRLGAPTLYALATYTYAVLIFAGARNTL